MAGSVGKIKLCNDFLGSYNSVAWGSAQLVAGDGLGGMGFTSVNEGSFASTVDEPGGILAITTDTGDNDNAALFLGPFQPSTGGPVVNEWRYKYSNVDCAIFCGFTETLAADTPVMPAEFATATMTYNGTGGMVGIQYDVDGTTDDFRAVMGDGGAAKADSGNGIRANATVTADRWFITRVVLNPDGSAEVWHSDSGHVDGSGYPVLRLIKKFDAGINPADLFFATLMIENRSAAARVLEVDYGFVEAGRDWRCD